ncbi:DUF3791 domain-containing protein [uncultured Bacteroides sp.]|uniref:DUF3791 domain-containing protein n=1 Tax=uncultured Bacteroides sp. TaxID=162156 RepID=UPI0025D7C98B|nr:DUF3791 domain-containing protein [uncultured Bacteroides sp.]
MNNQKTNLQMPNVNELNFTIALISEFSKRFNLGQKQAFNYINRFKGMQFLRNHYQSLHTQSFDDAIDDILTVCQRNGGKLK